MSIHLFLISALEYSYEKKKEYLQEYILEYLNWRTDTVLSYFRPRAKAVFPEAKFDASIFAQRKKRKKQIRTTDVSGTFLQNGALHRLLDPLGTLAVSENHVRLKPRGIVTVEG